MDLKFKTIILSVPFLFFISCSDSNEISPNLARLRSQMLLGMQQTILCITNLCSVRLEKTIAKKHLMT